MLRLQSVTCKEYPDQADIVIDVGFSMLRDNTLRGGDRERLAELTNLLERTARDYLVERQS